VKKSVVEESHALGARAARPLPARKAAVYPFAFLARVVAHSGRAARAPRMTSQSFCSPAGERSPTAVGRGAKPRDYEDGRCVDGAERMCNRGGG